MNYWLSFKNWLGLFCKGVLMGFADLIPGVSGGTIAFALGIHPQLLSSIKSIRLKTLLKPPKALSLFLSALVLGALLSLSLGSHLIYYCLNHSVYQEFLRALFMGLVVSSIYYCFKKIDQFSFGKGMVLLLGALIALGVSATKLSKPSKGVYEIPFQITTSLSNEKITNYDVESKSITSVNTKNLREWLKQGVIHSEDWIYRKDYEKYVQVGSCFEFNKFQYFDLKLFICGAVAICAMLLPGVSGSQVMQMFGFYDQVISSIALWTKGLSSGVFFSPSFWVLLNLGLGILFGLAFFSRFFIFLYNKYPNGMLALLIGFMLGSLATLWPFYSLSHKLSFQGQVSYLQIERIRPVSPSLLELKTWISFLFFAVGACFLMWIQKIEKNKEGFNTENRAS